MEPIKQAIDYIQAGKLTEARAALSDILRNNPKDDQAWLLMSFAVSERPRQIECVQRALQINPDNPNAQDRLRQLSFPRPAESGSAPAAPAPSKPAASSLGERLSTRQGSGLSSSPTASNEDWRASLGTETGKSAPVPSEKIESKPVQDTRPDISYEALTRKPGKKAEPPAKEMQDKKRPPSVGKKSTSQKGNRRGCLWLAAILSILAIAAGLTAATIFGWPTIQKMLPGNVLAARPATATLAATTLPEATPSPQPPTPTERALRLPPTWTATFTPAISATPQPSQTPSPTASAVYQRPGLTLQARIFDIADQAAEIRGLPKPIELPVSLGQPEQYLDTWSAVVYTDEYIKNLQGQGQIFIHLGLLPRDFDFVAYTLGVRTQVEPAVYIPWEKHLLLINPDLSGVNQFVFVYEYTQATIDYSYSMVEALGLYPNCRWSWDRCRALQALTEGDASFAMYQWWDTYADQTDIQEFWYHKPPEASDPNQPYPPFVALDSMFPYDAGYEFVESMYNRGGWNAVNRVYENLPMSSEQILHPTKYTTLDEPFTVPARDLEQVLGEDWERIAENTLGEWLTYLILGYGADPLTQLEDSLAREAAAGWEGDHMQAFAATDLQASILVTHWVWEDNAAADQFNTAFLDYQARRFANLAEFERGVCGEIEQQFSCLLSNDRESVWLVAPSPEDMENLLSAYPEFR